MDEEYVLVSKASIKNYKDEITKLKKLLDEKKDICEKKKEEKEVEQTTIEKQEHNEELIDKIILKIREEFKTENTTIVKHLEDIKELNRSTLDNLLTNTKALDDRLENMIDTISQLVNTLSQTIDSFTTSSEFDLKMIASKIDKIPLLNKQVETNIQGGSVQGGFDIQAKLNEIQLFMKNLKILLSYVKPADMKIERHN